jgi:hypothetical protein
MENSQSTRIPTSAKRVRNTALVLLSIPLILLGLHELVWYMPVTSYTYVLRAYKGNIIAHHSSDDGNVATAIRDAFNQGEPAMSIPGGGAAFIMCSHTADFGINPPPPQSFTTWTYTFSLWGVPVESVSGWVNDCPAVQVDSVLSPTIWMWPQQSIPYDPTPNPVE